MVIILTLTMHSAFGSVDKGSRMDMREEKMVVVLQDEVSWKQAERCPA